MDNEVRPVEKKLQRAGSRPRQLRRARSSSCARRRKRWASGTRTCRRSGTAWASAPSRWPSSPQRPGRTGIGPFAINAQAPDEGNMHTLLHWATDDQKERYLRPLAEGRARSCFAMTEPEVAGSDPTLIQTRAVKDGDDWVINGHKWFISGAKGAQFAILIACTDPDADPPQARNCAFLVDLPDRGVRDRARHRHDARPRQPLRDPHHRPARAGRPHARRPGRRPPARAVPPRARRGWPTACAGSATPRSRSRCWSTARSSATPTARCWPTSRRSSG